MALNGCNKGWNYYWCLFLAKHLFSYNCNNFPPKCLVIMISTFFFFYCDCHFSSMNKTIAGHILPLVSESLQCLRRALLQSIIEWGRSFKMSLMLMHWLRCTSRLIWRFSSHCFKSDVQRVSNYVTVYYSCFGLLQKHWVKGLIMLVMVFGCLYNTFCK